MLKIFKRKKIISENQAKINQIVENCLDILKSDKTFVKSYAGEGSFATYDIYEYSNSKRLFSVSQSWSSGYTYTLEFDNYNTRLDSEGFHSKDVDLSGLGKVFAYANDKYKKRKEKSFSSEYQSFLDYTNNVLTELNKSNLER